MSAHRDQWPTAEKWPHLKYTGNAELRVLHSIRVGSDTVVEVAGDPSNGSYEWGIRTLGVIDKHSDCGYGDSTVALSEGLIEYHGLPGEGACKKVELLKWEKDDPGEEEEELAILISAPKGVDLGCWNGLYWQWGSGRRINDADILGWARLPQGLAEGGKRS